MTSSCYEKKIKLSTPTTDSPASFIIRSSTAMLWLHILNNRLCKNVSNCTSTRPQMADNLTMLLLVSSKQLNTDCFKSFKCWIHRFALTYMHVCQLGRHRRTAWASYQIRRIAGCACAVNAGNDFPVTDFKGNRSLAIPVSITARASCTCNRDRLTRDGGDNVTGIPAHAQPTILRIWQEAHLQIKCWG